MNFALGRFVVAQDMIDNARRRDDEEWEAMHRRPDALPLPDEPGRRIVPAGSAVLRFIRLLTGRDAEPMRGRPPAGPRRSQRRPTG